MKDVKSKLDLRNLPPLDPAELEAVRRLTDEEVLTAALSDPDAQPLTDEQLSQMRRVSPVRHVRLLLGLTQAEFAARFHLPIGTIRDWEQHRSEPDTAARVLLKVIEKEPQAVARALAAA